MTIHTQNAAGSEQELAAFRMITIVFYYNMPVRRRRT